MTLLVSSGSQKIQFSFIIFRISLQASVLFFSPVQLQFIVLDEEIQAFRTSKRWKLFRHLLGNNTPPLWSCCYNCPPPPLHLATAFIFLYYSISSQSCAASKYAALV